jgi:cell division septum initiation protein DivIVA
MTDTKWMTYAELAEVLGIGSDSARNLVRRKRWPRQSGNDGLARIGVPIEYINENAKPDVPVQPPIDASADGGADGAIVVTVLANHISRLERELEALKQEHEAERERLEGRAEALEDKVAALEQDLATERLRAAQLDALNAVIEAERRRVEDLQAERDSLRADRDRWAGQAEKLAVPERRGLFGWLRRA